MPSGESYCSQRRKSRQNGSAKILLGRFPKGSQNPLRSNRNLPESQRHPHQSGFNLTKWITSDDEVKSQIPEADRSMIVVKTFEAEPQSTSNLRLNWNVDRDSLIVCRGTEQEIPAKITQRTVLSFVSAVFDPLGICSPFTIRMRFLLKSVWAAVEQAWDKELSAENSKLFSDWCFDLREIRTMSINRLYFENGCTNLRLHIFTDASEEAMGIVAHLQDEAALKLTYIIGKYRVATIRQMMIPKLELEAAVYGVRSRKQILDEHDVKNDKIYHWTDSSPVLQWLQAAHKKQQVFDANRAAEILETHRWINGDTSKLSKTLPTSEPEECPSKTSRSPYGYTGRHGSRQMKKSGQSHGVK